MLVIPMKQKWSYLQLVAIMDQGLSDGLTKRFCDTLLFEFDSNNYSSSRTVPAFFYNIYECMNGRIYSDK
jgi:hypothetical protein